MASVFLSYRRVEPDRGLARYLYRFLGNQDHEVFIDETDIRVGTHWQRSIDENLRRCEWFVPLISASYLYSDGEGSHFLDQESFETLTLSGDVMGNALDFLVDGTVVEMLKYNGNPIGLELPVVVELAVAFTEPGVRGDSSSGSVTKPARLETGLEIKVPLFIKEGEKVRVATATGEFGGRA